MEESHKPKQFFSMDLPFRLKKKVNPNPNENTVRVATISSGDFFGEEDFFEERPRELNAIVMSNKARMYRLSHHVLDFYCSVLIIMYRNIRQEARIIQKLSRK